MIDSLLKTVHHVSEQVSTMLRGHTWGEGSGSYCDNRSTLNVRCSAVQTEMWQMALMSTIGVSQQCADSRSPLRHLLSQSSEPHVGRRTSESPTADALAVGHSAQPPAHASG